MDAADVKDARTTFERCRNRGSVWGVASSPPPAPETLDAFTPADTLGLVRTLRALCATLPARTAFVHRDSLWCAADPGGNSRNASEHSRRKRAEECAHGACELREIVALCPFGDALAAAAPLTRGRETSGSHAERIIVAFTTPKSGKAQVLADVCESSTERTQINVLSTTWPRRRELNERLQAAFDAEWTAISSNAPVICGTPERHSLSSRKFGRLSRR